MVFMCLFIFSIIINFGYSASLLNKDRQESNDSKLYEFVTREEWKARPSVETTTVKYPLPFVVIHHSYTPEACHTRKNCSKAMRSMQNYHIDSMKWWDIGYNFAVGSDGDVYEGRGWLNMGAHAKNFNSVSYGICLIGDWMQMLPPDKQLEAAKSLIAAGVVKGYIKPDYKLVGHRQVRETQCPGDTLFKEIQTWEHFSPKPASVIDLVNMNEISSDVKEQILKDNVIQ